MTNRFSRFLLIILVAAASLSASAQSRLGDILKGLGNAESSDTTAASSPLGSILGGVVGGLLASDNVTPEAMVGSWTYAGPAVSFQSDNFLQKAGGAAAASTIEKKLEAYYKKLRLNNLQLTINDDLTFEMKSGVLRASGTVSKADNGDILFNFKAVKAVNLGSMKAYVTITGSKSMSLMFDVKKLVTILKTVSSVAGSSTLSTATKMLESYDGICAGFKLNRTTN